MLILYEMATISAGDYQRENQRLQDALDQIESDKNIDINDYL